MALKIDNVQHTYSICAIKSILSVSHQIDCAKSVYTGRSIDILI
jgi:hypothetical protein